MSSIACREDFTLALLTPQQAIPSGLKAANAQEAAHRFAVHRNNVVVSLIDALADAFPVCRLLVGNAFFRAMARERVRTEPPRSPVLSQYAQGFAEFIAGFAPAASLGYLADVARLENLHLRAWHAADAEPAAEAAYGALVVSPQCLAQTRVRLHPACSWVRCEHAAYAIWVAHQGLTDPADAALDRIDTSRAQDVLVARPGLEVEVAALPPGAIEFLGALQEGQCLGTAFGAALAAHPGAEIGALFAILLRHRLVVAFDPSTEH